MSKWSEKVKKKTNNVTNKSTHLLFPAATIIEINIAWVSTSRWNSFFPISVHLFRPCSTNKLVHSNANKPLCAVLLLKLKKKSLNSKIHTSTLNIRKRNEDKTKNSVTNINVIKIITFLDNYCTILAVCMMWRCDSNLNIQLRHVTHVQ